jgi:hypothetical protein
VFLGHFAVAMGAKRVAPHASLGTLVLAAQFADLLWPLLLLAGLEHVRIAPHIMAATSLEFVDYPISHSLLSLLGWGVLVGGLYWVVRRQARAAWVVGAAVVSHWVLDLIVHQPDLPLIPGGGPRLGLGVWHSVPATLALEFGFFALGIALYLNTTQARDGIGRIAFWAFVVVLAGIYLAAAFGPPPPSVSALAATALAGWLLVLWGYWIDRHRTSRKHP